MQDDWIDTAMRENSFNPSHGHYASLQRLIDACTAPAMLSNSEVQTGES